MPEPLSRILKANSARELPTRVAFNFEDLREQAAAQLSKAREEAASIVDQARRDAEALRQKTIEEARVQGRKEGLQTAQQTIDQQVKTLVEQRFSEHLTTTLPALAQAAGALREERDHWLLRWEQAAVELGVAIAEKLLKSNLAAKPELAAGMIAEALQLAAGQPQLKVRLHPLDLERLGAHSGAVVQHLKACGMPELIADATISPGGCVIDTQHGEIDARLETMLNRIASELLAN